jgi:tetratricopeptide (TPR) repeat protein
MKKSFLLLLSLLMTVALAQAQEDPVKLSKQAGRALTSYNIDPSNNAAKLEEAKTKIDKALEATEVQATPGAWITKGEIYNTMLQRDMARRMIDPNAALTGDNDALVAFGAFLKAYELTDKKYEKADAVKGISELQGHLVNIGVFKYEAGQYEKAFLSFEAALRSHEILTANSQKSILEDRAQMENQRYITGLAAQLAGRAADAERYYEALYQQGTDKPAIYEGLYNIKMEKGDTAAAEKILTEGRQKFPKDSGLLFAEINAYLKKGKLEELIERLKQAIEQEPTNVSLYVTLGSVFDNLHQRESQANNPSKSEEYFAEAKKYYQKATDVDPKNVDAIYSIGALYYNKAAVRTQELNALPEDFTAAGMKKYEKLKNEIMALFEEALPYFQRAESLDPNDMNTLIALSEIFARKDELEKALEFKKRLEVVRDGGKNTSSFFKD